MSPDGSDIPFHTVDSSDQYRRRVVDYTFSEYAKGRTPNPDVLCNREIKFDVFLKEALKLGADFVATGHYCRKAEETAPDGRTIYKLLAGSDPNKDQSYFSLTTGTAFPEAGAVSGRPPAQTRSATHRRANEARYG